MWKILHIFDGDYGCEETSFKDPTVSVTLSDETGQKKMETIPDLWLRELGLTEDSELPDYSGLCLKTRDLILKKASAGDWRDIYRNLWSSRESSRYMLWEATESETDAKRRLDRTLLFQKYHKYAFLVYEKFSGQAIGFAGMREIEPGVFEDTGVALGPSFVRKGYGTQILEALLFEAAACGARKFIGTCRRENIASHRLMMKCGFTFSHFEDRIDPRDGTPYVLEFNEIRL